MKRNRWLWGSLLIAAGVVLLLQNLGLFDTIAPLVWTILFAVGGVAFLLVFAGNRAHWWALIPGMVLLSLGMVVFLDQVAPGRANALSGSIFLGGIGLAFWLIYVTRPQHWWAIIPGGVLWTLAAVSGLETVWSVPDYGGVFFAGLAATFAVVYLLPTPGGRMRWALFPASACALMSLVIFAAVPWVLTYVGPAALILGGVYLLFRAQHPRRTAPMGDDTAQPLMGNEEPHDTPSLPQPH